MLTQADFESRCRFTTKLLIVEDETPIADLLRRESELRVGDFWSLIRRAAVRCAYPWLGPNITYWEA
jgi:hypothetical protein